MTDPGFAQGLVGVTLDGRYRLDAVLGEGGMGSVFRATQLAMDRKVAVKLLKPHLTGDRVALERFSREARATMKVESQHAVKVLDFGVTPLGDYYMVLEYLDGRTVQRELEIDGPFAPVRVAHIARQALDALGVAHAQGLIHRDVKPENLLLMRVGGDGDYTKILDFGVAKLMQGTAGEQLALTAAGMVFGTPEFMSPEQACGQPLDGRSDLYSLAATMFVMLTGTTLFEGTTAIEWLTHHARTPAPALAMVRPELAAFPELDALLQRCLAKPREQRPAHAAEMARLLAEVAPTLARTTAAAPPRTSSRPTVHPSSFVLALREPPAVTAPTAAAVDPSGTGGLAAPDRGPRVAPSAGPDSAATTGVSTRTRRRRIALWLGGAAVAAVVGTAVGLSVQRPDGGDRLSGVSGAPPASSGASGSGTSGVSGSGTSAAHPAVPPESPVAESPPAATTSTPTAPVAPVAPSAPVQPVVAQVREAPVAQRPTPGRVPRGQGRAGSAARNPEAEQHLRDAEEALQGGQTLRQLAEADLALRAAPGNPRALFLLGDALIKSGDLEKGCKYLAALKRLPSARARARAASCPDD